MKDWLYGPTQGDMEAPLQHQVRTSKTNGACTGYTTNVFADRVTIPVIEEAMNKGQRIHLAL